MKHPTPVVAVWILFAVAFVVPALENGDSWSKHLGGWRLFCAALFSGWLFPTVSALSNALMFAPAIHFRTSPGEPPSAWLIASFVGATVLNSHWLWDGRAPDAHDLLIGFWLWLGSFPAMAIALVWVRRCSSARSVVEEAQSDDFAASV